MFSISRLNTVSYIGLAMMSGFGAACLFSFVAIAYCSFYSVAQKFRAAKVALFSFQGHFTPLFFAGARYSCAAKLDSASSFSAMLPGKNFSADFFGDDVQPYLAVPVQRGEQQGENVGRKRRELPPLPVPKGMECDPHASDLKIYFHR
jgi:hypothetical protein